MVLRYFQWFQQHGLLIALMLPFGMWLMYRWPGTAHLPFGFACLMVSGVVHWRCQTLLTRGLLIGIVGCVAAGVHTEYALHPELSRLTFWEPSTISGTVKTVQRQGKGERLELALDTGGWVRLWSANALHVSPKTHVQLAVTLTPIHTTLNPGGFDAERQAFVQSLWARGKVHRVIERTPHPPSLRMRWLDKAARALEGLRYPNQIRALVFGESRALTPPERQRYQATGTGHLLAISGLHLGSLAFVVLTLVRGLLRWRPEHWRLPPHRIAWCFTLALLTTYALLAGFSLPTQRALGGALIWFLGESLTPPLSWRSRVQIIWVLLLLTDPRLVLSPSAFLSFGAVLVIAWLAQVPRRSSSIGQRLHQWLLAHWHMSWALLPLSVIWFSKWSLLSPIANALAIPMVTLWILPTALLGSLLALVHAPWAHQAFRLADGGLSVLNPALEWLHQITWAEWAFAVPGVLTSLMALAGMAWCLAPRGVPHRPLGILLLSPLFWVADAIPHGQCRWTVLDVGQGLSVVLQTQLHTLVYDAGPAYFPNGNAGDSVLNPFLKQQGVAGVDTLILSHLDNDHIGGAQAIIDAYSPQQILSSADWPEAARCTAQQSWEWDGVHFEMLYPTNQDTGSKNHRSCVLKVTAGQEAILLTGDIDAKAEDKLVRRLGSGLVAQLLLVPHHGSKSSSSLEFLEAVQPQVALIPRGFANRYHHPHASVISRYNDLKIRVLDSSRLGALSGYLGRGEAAEVRGYRATDGRRWHDWWPQEGV